MSVFSHQRADDEMKLLYQPGIAALTKLTGKWGNHTPHPQIHISTQLSCVYLGRHNNFLMTRKREAGVGVRG